MFVAFRPNVRLISSTRCYVAELLSTLVSDEDAISRVVLTIHELLENALKYSTDGEARLLVSIATDAELGRLVEVRTENRTTSALAVELAQNIDSLSAAADPLSLYISMMRESVKREGSGLGLARIRVEGEMELSYAIKGDRLTVSAATREGS